MAENFECPTNKAAAANDGFHGADLFFFRLGVTNNGVELGPLRLKADNTGFHPAVGINCVAGVGADIGTRIGANGTVPLLDTNAGAGIAADRNGLHADASAQAGPIVGAMANANLEPGRHGLRFEGGANVQAIAGVIGVSTDTGASLGMRTGANADLNAHVGMIGAGADAHTYVSPHGLRAGAHTDGYIDPVVQANAGADVNLTRHPVVRAGVSGQVGDLATGAGAKVLPVPDLTITGKAGQHGGTYRLNPADKS